MQLTTIHKLHPLPILSLFKAVSMRYFKPFIQNIDLMDSVNTINRRERILWHILYKIPL